jgi:hypothetical protein
MCQTAALLGLKAAEKRRAKARADDLERSGGAHGMLETMPQLVAVCAKRWFGELAAGTAL